MNSQAEFDPGERVFNLGSTQADRTAGVPKPQSVLLDGRSPAALLGFAGDYGKLIRFYDLDDQPDGDWSAFFTADRGLRAAGLLGLDMQALVADCDRIDRKSTRLNSSHITRSRMPSSA